ncbi:ABC transporter permease [Nitrosomonas mobilis]|uniref:Putative ABC-2 type transport system permease protein n=1 Tax=Nitrosomonas mobilis TaxID=51642 RepID=A0A1G5SFT3_9PROT|nr:ABC transporter permease subunit [Nitrosomonas mobilis]SCZ86053.1 putative ABC-2 type transport system permease protein [Nitrosomonas mobilis]
MMLVMIRKELRLLLASSLVWSFLALTQLVLAWVFLGRLDTFLEIQPQLMQLANPPGITEIIVAPVFSVASIILLMVTPIMSMRLLAEEKRNQTLVMLLSAPVSGFAIVMAKFFALLLFLLTIPLLIVVLSFFLLMGGTLDFGLLFSNVIGLILLAGCFASLGLYISSLTAHPAIAALGSFGVLLCFWMIDIVSLDAESVIHDFSPFRHYEHFNLGIIDSFSVIFMIFFMVIFLTLTVSRLANIR